jgi:RNA polymerase sigma-70 factor (ECF subfamily)
MNLSMADSSAGGPEQDEDTRLLVAARGDPYAFEAFYRRNASTVFSYFYPRTFCAHVSADLAAETWAQAYASRRQFRDIGGSAVGWVLGIARNQYKDWVRRSVVEDKARRKLGIVTPAVDEDDLDQVVDTADLQSTRDELTARLTTLSPALRDAVLLRVGMDLSYADVAKQLGCSVGAARVRVSRGLDQIMTASEAP